MIIKQIDIDDVKKEFRDIKLDLIDQYAIYFGLFVDDILVGITGFQYHVDYIYLCHAFIKEEYRKKGYYTELFNYRKQYIEQNYSPDINIIVYCNQHTIEKFISNGYKIDKFLVKMVKE